MVMNYLSTRQWSRVAVEVGLVLRRRAKSSKTEVANTKEKWQGKGQIT